jgi:hypothetical protein
MARAPGALLKVPTRRPLQQLRDWALAYSANLVELDFSHLSVLHTATVRPSTKAIGTFCSLLPSTDTQKVALVKRKCSCWKPRALGNVG